MLAIHVPNVLTDGSALLNKRLRKPASVDMVGLVLTVKMGTFASLALRWKETGC